MVILSCGQSAICSVWESIMVDFILFFIFFLFFIKRRCKVCNSLTKQINKNGLYDTFTTYGKIPIILTCIG